MPRLSKLSIAMMCASLPLTGAWADDMNTDVPSNQQLHQMILELKQQLQETKEENDRLKNQTIQETYVGVPDTYDESKPIGKEAIPLNSKLQQSYLTFESADRNISYKFDGRIMLDTGYAQNSKDGVGQNIVKSETEFRRLRFAIKGKFYENWQGEFDLDFADLEDGLTSVEVKDAWIAYTGFRNTSITIGSHKPNFSMEEVTTSRWENLIETSMVADTWAPGRRIGVSVNHWDTNYMIGVTAFGDEYTISAADEQEGERYGWAARSVYRPWVAEDNSSVIHLGLNLKHEVPQSDDGDRLRFRARPEVKFLRTFGPDDDGSRYLNTGRMDADSAFTWGLELAGKMGPLYAQAEYMKTEVDVPDGIDPEFDGWYIKGGWFISGGEREYSYYDSEFGKVYPTSSLGAWEVVLRYSTFDLNDESAGITGGQADNITLGLNWYINNNFLVRANYINVDNDENADGDGDFVGNDDLDIFAFRAQWMF